MPTIARRYATSFALLYFAFLSCKRPTSFLTTAVVGLTLVSRTAPEPLNLVAAEPRTGRGCDGGSAHLRGPHDGADISESLAQRRFTVLLPMNSEFARLCERHAGRCWD